MQENEERLRKICFLSHPGVRGWLRPCSLIYIIVTKVNLPYFIFEILKKNINFVLQGDSGGPLMCKASNDPEDYQWVLIGIASFRHYSGCASGIPDSFTRVPSFGQWITHQIDYNGGPRGY